MNEDGLSSDGTKPGFGLECFITFRIFQGKQKSSNPKWLVSNLFFFFRETFWHRRTWTIQFGGAAPCFPKKFSFLKKVIEKKPPSKILPELFRDWGAAAPPAPLANTPMRKSPFSPLFIYFEAVCKLISRREPRSALFFSLPFFL